MTVIPDDELTRTLRGSHRATFEARGLRTFQTGDDPDGEDIPILSGDVQLDGTAEVRATASLEVRGRWFHRAENSLLSVYGHEVFLRRGVDLGSEVLWVPLGYYRIDALEQDDAPRGPIRLACFDRMKSIVDARLLEPRTYRPETTVGVFFEDLVGEVYPAATISFDDASGSETLGREVLVEEDRYAALLDVATGLGKVMYWNDEGIFTVETAPDPSVPIWAVDAGYQGVQISAARRLSRDGVYNAVVATGEGGDDTPPVRAVAVDANPLSPTFFGGSFGRVPRFYASPFLTTAVQAETAALATLRRSVGLPYSVDFQSVVNPALRPYDPVRIRYSDGTREVHVVERLTIPLDESTPMAGGTREQTLSIVQVLS